MILPYPTNQTKEMMDLLDLQQIFIQRANLSTNFHSESIPFIKKSKQSHRYALRSRGSCDLPTDDNQDARDELIPEGN